MTSDETDLTAAELALEVLDGDERTAALRRMLDDPAFARDVARWRRHLAALYLEVEPVAPSAVPDLGGRSRVSPVWRLRSC